MTGRELRAMEKIIVYKCDYCGKLIDTQEECAKHEQRHRNVEGANEMLRSGATLEDINQRYGIWYSVPEHLKNVTKDHCFTISYWQCCDKPAYTIKGIDMDGRLYVFGIGSWSGGYGCEVPIDSTNLKEVHSPDELFVDSRYGKGRW